MLPQQHDAPQDVWDVYFASEHERGLIKVARLTGDIPNRRKTDTMPASEYTAAVPVRIRPYFTVNNDLAISVKPLGQTRPSPQSG
jgi:hypothetical protein